MQASFFSKRGFPQIYPVDSSGSNVQGFITALNEEFYVHLNVLDTVGPKKVRLQGNWKLQQLLKPVVPVLEQHLALCDTVVDMLQELKNILEQQMKTFSKNSLACTFNEHYHQMLLKQLQNVGWDRISYISPELDAIELKALDEHGRKHVLQINLPKEFPDSAPVCSCDLPEEFPFKWSSNKSLLDLYNQFQACLGKYFEFWNCMDEIDANTWVLEPEKPTMSVCKRRIAIAATASLLVIVNPTCSTCVPLCHFLGPDKIVGPLKEKFSQNIDRWNENVSLLVNLRNVLDIEFPSPFTSTKEELCIDCGICYAYKLGDFLPDVVCCDQNCAQPFHQSCLYEWLRSITTTRHSFNRVFGDCPYCSKPIWCMIPGSRNTAET